MIEPDNFEKWFKPIKDTWLRDYKDGIVSIKVDPEKIKPVSVSLTPWIHNSLDRKCEICGWPRYLIKIGLSTYDHCPNPECPNSYLSGMISKGLQNEDQLITNRRERIRKKREERAAKEKADRELETVIEGKIRQILFSYGIRVRKSPGRGKK